MRSVHALLLLLALGCGSESAPPVRGSLLPHGGGGHAGTLVPDASLLDAAVDAGTPDAGIDAGTSDAGVADASGELQICPNGSVCPIEFFCCPVGCVEPPGPCP